MWQQWVENLRQWLTFSGLPGKCVQANQKASNRPRRKWFRPHLESLEWRITPSAQAVADYANNPLSFEVNRGQTDSQVRYLSHGSNYALFLTPTEAVLSLSQPTAPALSSDAGTSAAPKSAVVTMQLVGANPAPQITGQDELPGTINYINGSDPSAWITGVNTYGQVQYQDVYPGIDLIYHGNQQQLEYDFTVKAGANPSAIQLNFQGVAGMNLDAQGNLVLQAAGGDVVEHAPVLYQTINGVQQAVSGGYVLLGNGQVGFQVGAHDPTQPLVIDPVVGYATYFGGGGEDNIVGITTDSAGNGYITGTTFSDDLPATDLTLQSTFNAFGGEAFVAKLNAQGQLLWRTYYGGNPDESKLHTVTDPNLGFSEVVGVQLVAITASGIGVDASGNVYLAGNNTFTNRGALDALVGLTSIPVVNPLIVNGQALIPGQDPALTDGTYGFLACLSPDGGRLLYSTYLSDVADAYLVSGLSVASNGTVYVTGTNLSPSNIDSFVAKVSAAGGMPHRDYLVALGSPSLDGSSTIANAIAVDGSGNAYIGGDTNAAGFAPKGPTNATATLGGFDSFVTKLDPNGNTLFATRLGGNGDEAVNALAVDGSGDVYLGGTTFSTNFPMVKALQSTDPDSAGGATGFVAELNASGSALVYSTYLGGQGANYPSEEESGLVDSVSGIAVDADGNAYVTGDTASTNFPSVNAVQAKPGGGYDAFVTKISTGGTAFAYSTYLGGSGNDAAAAIAVDPYGNAYIAGITATGVDSPFPDGPEPLASSPNFPVTQGPSFAGGGTPGRFGYSAFLYSDGFIAKIGTGLTVTVQPETDFVDEPYTGTVATFTSPTPGEPISNFSATIDWGDGTTTTGIVQATNDPLAPFEVVDGGNHEYTQDGSDTVNVTVTDSDPVQAKGSATAKVALQMATIEINNTKATNDNITLFSPSSAPQGAFAQSIPAKITNNSDVAAVFHLSVQQVGTGNVQLSFFGNPANSSIDVTVLPGQSEEVTVIPTAISSPPNDVHIVVSYNGTAVASDDMTVVSVSFQQDIRNKDTPAGMADRIPPIGPAPTSVTPIDVTVTPDLSRTDQFVTLAVTGQNANNGTVAINGNTTLDINSMQSINLSGVTQTEPSVKLQPDGTGHFINAAMAGQSNPFAGNLMLVVKVRGEDTIKSKGFSVAAIPVNWTSTFDTDDHPDKRGIITKEGMSSDSGNPNDLDQIAVHEEIEVESSDGVFRLISSHTAETINDYTPASTITIGKFKDELAVDKAALTGNRARVLGKTGSSTRTQTWVFLDARTGSIDIPIPNSGFVIKQLVYIDPRGNRVIKTSKMGVATSANGFSSGAGTASTPFDQANTKANTATDTQLVDTSDPLVVTTPPPSSVTAGSSFGLVITAENADGSVNTSFNGDVTLASADGNSLGGMLTATAVNGVATFSGLTEDRAGFDALLASATGLPTVTTDFFDVTAAPVAQLVVSSPSGNVFPRLPFSLEVQAQDSYGNVDPNFSGTVTLFLENNPIGTSLGGTVTATASNGIASFSGLTINGSGSGFTLQATSLGLTPGTSSPFNVTNDQLVVTTQPSSTVTAGDIFGLIIKAEDGSGTVDPSFNGFVTLALPASDGGSGFLGGTLTVMAVNGVATFSDLMLDQTGAYDLLATSNGVAATTTDIIQVDATPTRLVVTAQPPGTVTAGSEFSVTIAVEDALGNVATSANGTVTLALVNPGSATLGGTLTATLVNGVAEFSDLTINNPGIGYTLQASCSGLTGTTTGAIDVTALGIATHLVVTTQPPSSLTVGNSFGLVVAAEDDFGTVDTGFIGTVMIDNPSDGTTLAQMFAVNGVADFPNLTLDQAGDVVLTLSSNGLASVTTNAFAENALPATQFSFVGPFSQVLPGMGAFNTVLPGAPFDLQVLALDSFGNVDPTFNGGLTFALANNPANGTLGGTLTVAAVNGIASFSGLTLNNVGSGYTLQATSTGLATGTSLPFDVTNDQFVVTTQPVNTSTGTGFGVIVLAEHANGFADTSFNGSVTVALVNLNPTDNGAVLVGTLTEAATDGVVSFPGLELGLPGDYALVVSSDGVGSTLTDPFVVVGNPVPLALAAPTPGATAFQGFPTATLALANFLGTDGSPASYTATINWGDGTPTAAGTVSVSGQDVTVSGAHNFQMAGAVPVTVTLTNGAGESSTSVATVEVQPDLSRQVRVIGLGGPVNPQTGLVVSTGVVSNLSGIDLPGPLFLVVQGLPTGVTLADADGRASTGDPYHALATSVLQSGQSEQVALEFSDPGLMPFTYSVVPVGGTGSPTGGPAGPVGLMVTNNPFVTTEGIPFTGTVATFSDPADDPANSYTVTITWGDGTTSAGTVTSAGPGRYVVTGAHTYAEDGLYSYSVRVQDTEGISASATSTAVGPAPGGSVIYHVTVDTSALAGTSGFLDFQLNPGTLPLAQELGAVLSNFSTIGGAGGTPTFHGDASGSLTGTMLFDNQTMLNDARLPFTFGSSLSFDVRLSGPAVAAPAGGRFGSTFSLTLLASDDMTPLQTSDSSGAVARLGVSPDGSTSQLLNGGTTPSMAQFTALAAATVLDAPLRNALQVPVHPVEGQPFTGVVATFADTNPLAPATDFTATVLWGDGTPASAGTVTAALGGGFQVTASHTYAEAGSYVPVIQINDRGGSSIDAAPTAPAQVIPPGGLQARLSALANVVGGAFAVGDLNGDGKPDMVALTDGAPNGSSFTIDVEVTLNNGDGTFGTPTMFAAGNTPGIRGDGFVALDDVNGDGKFDIVTAGGVFLGNGNGTFGPLLPFPVNAGSNPILVQAGDFNSDGKLDLVIGNRLSLASDTAPDTVLLGNGDGTFRVAPAPYGLLSSVESFVAGDFNGDGKLDLLITDQEQRAWLALGNGDGSFQTPTLLASNFVVHVALDLNGDGKLDLVGDSAGVVQVWLGNVRGTFQPPTSISVGDAAVNEVAGDFNGDGKMDLAVVTNGLLPTGEAQGVFAGGSVILLLGHGDGTFASSARAAADFGGGQLAIADVNGDGKLDVVLTENAVVSGIVQVGVLLGNGNGTLVDMASVDTGTSILALTAGNYNGNNQNLLLGGTFDGSLLEYAVTASGTVTGAQPILDGGGPVGLVGDFNGDGKPDVVTGNSIVLGNGNGTFGLPSSVVADNSLLPYAVAEGDFNGDGQLDLMMDDQFGNLSVMLGNGDGTFRPSGFGTIQTGLGVGGISDVRQFAVADLNGDGKPDLVLGFGNEVVVLLGNGNGSFGPATTFPTTGVSEGIAVADFNGDGKLDLAVPLASGAISLSLGNGNGTFQTAVNLSAGTHLVAITAGDFNGDGKTDLVVLDEPSPLLPGPPSPGVLVLLGNGDGTFQTPIATVLPLEVQPGESVAVGDLNNDGKLDVAVVHDSAVNVFLGDGTGHFLAPHSFDLPAPDNAESEQITLADLNGDGKLDILGSTSAGTDILFGNGDGTFQGTPVDFSGLRDIFNAQTADLNNDGKADLVVATATTSGVTLSSLLSSGNGTFQAGIDLPPIFGPDTRTILVADFTGDGIPDVLVERFEQAPVFLQLFAGNGDGTFQPAVNVGTLNPASSTTPGWIQSGDVNGDGKLDLVAVSADPGIGGYRIETLLGNGDGTFQPEIVQEVPGLFPVGTVQDPHPVLADFNGDSKADLVLTTADGTVSGGKDLLLLGNGDGTYQAPQALPFVFQVAAAQTVGDFNGDGKQDVAFVDSNGVLHLALGNGNGTFQPINYDVGSIEGGISTLVAVDFTASGTAGFAIGNQDEDEVSFVLPSPSPSSAIVVADAPLTASGTSLRGNQGAALTAVVASFTDADPAGTLSDYTATITWGDGNTSAGTLLSDGKGGFLVVGTNTYAALGSFTATVSIMDKDGATAQASSTISVSAGTDAALTATGLPVTATAWLPVTAPVAHFTDADPAGTVSDFFATITWGDGNTSVGTVTAGSLSGFDVTGTHTYVAAGAYSTSVTIIDSGGTQATAAGTATVAPNSAPPLTASSLTLQTTAASAFTGIVATFTDADLADQASDYTASITWGDGQSSPGTITADPTIPGQFDVTGTNTYISEGSYSVLVHIRDTGGATTTASSTANVADAPLLAQGGNLLTGTEGTSLQGVVATFRDTDPYGSLSEYSASIKWGNGQQTSGTISADPTVAGQFDVTGSNTYAEAGVYTITVSIQDSGGAVATATSLAAVADAPLALTGVNASATAGTAFTAQVARFTDANAAASLGDFTATIAWGNGQITTGTVTADPSIPGQFDVSGTLTYNVASIYTLTVSVLDQGDSLTVVHPTSQVNPSSLIPGSLTIAATEGLAFTSPVGSFLAPGFNDQPDLFTALIDWGDGHHSAATIVADPMTPNLYQVIGAHTYVKAGEQSVVITVDGGNGAHGSITISASVADAPLTATGTSATATAERSFTGNVAFFTDANPAGSLGDYTATIDWGNGQSTPGTIAPDTGVAGQFDVTGTMLYTHEGQYTVVVHITDQGGAQTSAKSTLTVADAPLLAQGSLVPLAATAFQPTTWEVASFTDPDPSAMPSDYSATIDWQDGYSSPGTITVDPHGGFDVFGTTTYFAPGTFTATVTIFDQGGAQAKASSQVRVASPGAGTITVKGATISAEVGSTILAPLGQFQDSDPKEVLSDYTATLSFEGSSIPATIVPDSTTHGTYDVYSALKVSQPETDQFTLVVNDQDGTSGQAITTIQTSFTLNPSTLPAATINVAYNQTITASGGTGAKTLAVTNIANPIAGLNVPNSGTGSILITGTPTASGTETFTVTATDVLGTTTFTNYAITVNATFTVSGIVFFDFNANGVQDANDTVLAGQTVYLDLHHDGTLDAGDPTAVTDSNGAYTLTNVAASSWTVRLAADNVTLTGGAAAGLPVTVTTAAVSGANLGAVVFAPSAPVAVNKSIYGATNPDANTAYIVGLYQAVLGRAALADELPHWFTKLAGGETQQQVVLEFIQSTAHRQLEINFYYRSFLGRSESQVEQQYWVNVFFYTGASETTVVAGFLNSAEYQAEHASAVVFIQGLYTAALGRQVTTIEQASVQGELANGMTRTQLITATLASSEADQLAVEGFYAAYLHRSAMVDPGSTFERNLLSTGISLGAIQALILGDPGFQEFFHNAAATVL